MDKKGTHGLSDQEVFEIKEDYYGRKIGVDDISAIKNIPVWKVMYAVNLNETTLQMF